MASRSGLSLAAVLAATWVGGCAKPEKPAGLPEVSQGAIVGGRAVDVTKVPWQVSLQGADGRHFCGGAILAPSWVVTAQHCVENAFAYYWVVAGISHLSESDSGQQREVAEVVLYPGFSHPSMGRDIALLRLAEPLDLSTPDAKPIAPLSPDQSRAGLDAPGVMARVSGWGLTGLGTAQFPDALQQVEVPIISQADAAAAYAPTPLTDDQLAAGYLGVGTRDACVGDSGGALVVPDSSGTGFALAGIVSWGDGCADPEFPGMYARVSSFHGWMGEYLANSVDVQFTCREANTTAGQGVYVTGSASALGAWDVTEAVRLSPTANPAVWSAKVPVPAGQRIEWKCIKRDEQRPRRNLEWQPGPNNVLESPAQGEAEASASF